MFAKYFFGFFIIGYSIMTRSFAYLLGVPSFNIYLSEVAVFAVLLIRPGIILGRWVYSLAHRTVLSGVAWSALVLISYGFIELVRGLLSGYSVFASLSGFVFQFYIIYFFVGIWLGYRHPDFLSNLVRLLAWANGLYGLVYVLLLSDLAVTATIPGSPSIPLFGAPGASTIAILGLLLVNRNPLRVWPPLALNVFVILGMQIRAQWLALLIGLLLLALLTRRVNRLLLAALSCIAILVFLEAVNLQVTGRTEVLSLPAVISQAIAPFAPDLAEQIYQGGARHAGTAIWRLQFWNDIWLEVHKDLATAVFGLGYGYPLTTVTGDLAFYPLNLRTPHNFLFYALGYTGWLGVVIFGIFQVVLGRLLWHVYRVSRDPLGLIIWAMGITMALFSNFFETPFNAIPFYLLTGMSVAGLILTERSPARSSLSHPTDRTLQDTSPV